MHGGGQRHFHRDIRIVPAGEIEIDIQIEIEIFGSFQQEEFPAAAPVPAHQRGCLFRFQTWPQNPQENSSNRAVLIRFQALPGQECFEASCYDCCFFASNKKEKRTPNVVSINNVMKYLYQKITMNISHVLIIH